MNENGFRNAHDLASWLHYVYEGKAQKLGWKTQLTTRVPFDDLPKENKEVMLAVAEELIKKIKEGRRLELEELLKRCNKKTDTHVKTGKDIPFVRLTRDVAQQAGMKMIIELIEKRLAELKEANIK